MLDIFPSTNILLCSLQPITEKTQSRHMVVYVIVMKYLRNKQPQTYKLMKQIHIITHFPDGQSIGFPPLISILIDGTGDNLMIKYNFNYEMKIILFSTE